MSNQLPIMQFFSYAHLPEHLADVSQPFCDLAWQIHDNMLSSAELSAALRKLLESKDAAVRVAVMMKNQEQGK